VESFNLESYFAVSKADPVILNGATIRRLRKARGLTQEELADRLEVSTWTVRSWEADRTRPGSAQRALHLVEILEPEPQDSERTVYLPPEAFTLSDDGRLAAGTERGRPPIVFFLE
jgi:DNA-binding transcriptional regulator YiaG